MSRTIEAIIKHMVASDAKQETAPDRTANHFWLRSAEVASGICAFTARCQAARLTNRRDRT